MTEQLPSPSKQMSTRRKSCVVCVKAKRRCDLQKPYCTRCCTRNLLCNYPVGNGGVSNAQSFDLAFEYPVYPPSTNIPAFTPPYAYQFDDLFSPTLIPPKNISLTKDKLDSCVQYFRSYITNIVQNGRTPFIDPRIYEENALPPCLEDVYCVCAAYLSKTTANETMIFRIMSRKFDELLSKRPYYSFEDELASVQALIIYQILRLFDGDIRQRGIAEAHFQLLEAWAMSLRQRSELEIPLLIQASPYRRWLFIESVRRTVLMSIFLRAIYYCIRDGFCDKVPDLAPLPLTVRGELWEAKSESEWIQATSGIQPDVLTYHEFVEVWDGGSAGGNVEEFQKVLLLACIGEEGLQARFLESLTRGVGWTQ